MRDTEKTARIGVIHAALGSAAPLRSALAKAIENVEILNFVNEEMLSYANRNGVDQHAMRMFAQQVFHAQNAGVDLIIIACNIFAPRIADILPFVSVPVLTVDSEMQKKAARIGGTLGIIGTNRNAVPACTRGVAAAAEEIGLPVPAVEDGTVPEAAEVLASGNTAAFDRMIVTKALELAAQGCDAIILAQVTIARAKPALLEAGITIPVLTSPDECAGQAATLIHMLRLQNHAETETEQ